MALAESTQLGLAMRFDVVVDGFDLGSWSSCKGIDVAFKHEKVVELGQHAYATFIPGRAEYSPVVLQRAMSAGDWATTKRWLEQVAGDAWVMGSGVPRTATITLRDAKHGEVASWTLRNALPQAWKGPQLDADGKAVALETLELVHEGFLDD